MDDQGEYCWPRQLDPYAMILPDISTDKFENRSVEAAFREKEDLEIASHFTSTLNRIAQLHDKKHIITQKDTIIPEEKGSFQINLYLTKKTLPLPSLKQF